MIGAENYLKNYYDTFKIQDKAFNILKTFGSHLYIDNYYKELNQFNLSGNSIEDYNLIVNFFYKKYTKNLYKFETVEILNSIYNVNQTQYKKLKKDNFEIHVTNGNITDSDYNQIISSRDCKFPKNVCKINYKHKDFLKRKLILYYKSGDRNHKTWDKQKKFGVDIFNYCLMYEIVDRLIKDKLLKNFNQLEITPTFSGVIPPVFNYLKYNVKYYSKQDFIDNICLFSNTVYPYGSVFEAESCYTTNLVCTSTYLQKPYIYEWKNFIHLPFYFSKGKCIKGKQYVDGGHDGDTTELFGKYGYVGHNYYERVKKIAKNRSLDLLFKTFIEKIIKLDNYISSE
tara:strand:+ start:1782 stop:2804 length:1023 start_codon:yes stop_codon:yes gene_type:complete